MHVVNSSLFIHVTNVYGILTMGQALFQACGIEQLTKPEVLILREPSYCYGEGKKDISKDTRKRVR